MEFSQEISEKFLEQYSTSIDSIAKIAVSLGIHSKTIYSWRQKNTDFDAACIKARSFRAEVMVDRALEISSDRTEDFYIDGKGVRRIDHEAVNRSRLKTEICVKLAGMYNSKYSQKVMPMDMPKRNQDIGRMNDLYKNRKEKEKLKLLKTNKQSSAG